MLHDGGKVHRRDHPRPRLSGHRHSWLTQRGQYVADFFSGHGGVARAARKLGFSTREWELERGPAFDLTNKAVLFKIKEDVRKGRVIAAMLAPPCTTFSVARDRTCVIRTADEPWGVSDLKPGDAEKVRAGNQCMRSALSIIHWLEKHRIPYLFEHPYTSKAWYLPRLRWLRRLHHVQAVTTDFCQYGVSWRKRTLLLCSRIDEQDLVRCQRLCTGPPGFCATGLRHVQLTGSNKQGAPFTRTAQPYPAKLCHHLAFALTSHT